LHGGIQPLLLGQVCYVHVFDRPLCIAAGIREAPGVYRFEVVSKRRLTRLGMSAQGSANAFSTTFRTLLALQRLVIQFGEHDGGEVTLPFLYKGFTPQAYDR
jgi:hypothetical protein